MTDKIFLSWFAGYLDADGCFFIGLSEQRTKNPYLAIGSQVRIGQRYSPESERVMEFIKEKVGLGTIYYSNKKKADAIVYWQTTRHADSLKVAKLVYPYLQLKKERVRLYIEALEIWNKGRQITKGRFYGQKERSAEDVLRLVKIAVTINASRQTKRYRNYKGYDYWEPLIREWYS